MSNSEATEIRDWSRDPGVVAMERLRDGDLDAFAELFGKYREMVIRFAYGYLRSEDRAEDVAQNTFLRLFLARERYEPRARFTTYLFRIAANLCLNEIRSRGASPIVDAPSSAGAESVAFEDLWPDSESFEPSERLARREVADEVAKVLERLPSNQRRALLWARRDGLSYEEVAERLEHSRSAVKSLIFRAGATLRSELSELL
jgi:RNA polymerase sigma-70 factor, ECF subfamily